MIKNMSQSIIDIPKSYENIIEIKKTELDEEGLFNVYVNFLEKVSPGKRGTVLLNLEDELCKVNDKIRIWHIPLGDKNSLRNLRGIKF